MPSVRYVILSDLHFGEPNGLFGSAGAGESQAMDALVACLHDLCEGNDGVRPQLILAGDIFELALAPEHVVFEVFDQFLFKLFPEGQTARFDPTILFVPGNHDHALWTTTREERFAETLRTAPRDLPIHPHSRVTPTMAADPPISQLLTRMLQHRHPSHPDLKVAMSYPNAGRKEAGGLLVVHHGHFTDAIYSLMTNVAEGVFGGAGRAQQLELLEEDNGPWIDFLWSGLGRGGAVGSGMRRSYNLLHTDAGKALLATRLAVVLAQRGRTQLGRRVRQGALRAVLLRVLDALHETDVRYRWDAVAEVDPGVFRYLNEPVQTALAEEGAVDHSAGFTFVYGHTHHPLATRATLPWLDQPVRLYNCGGWVVDTDEARPAVGGGMVLVDERLDAVLVRMCSQTAQPHREVMRVQHADGATADTPLLQATLDRVSRRGGPWEAAGFAFANAILRRRSERRQQLKEELKALSGLERMALRIHNLFESSMRRSSRRKLLAFLEGAADRPQPLLTP